VTLAGLTEDQRGFFQERMHWWKGTPIGQHLDRVANDFNLINSKKGLELNGDQVRILLSQAREAATKERAATRTSSDKSNHNGRNHSKVAEKPRCKKGNPPLTLRHR